ncbi:MAG: hypothetical protein JXR10_01020 [Cyclobacteriaceae bacterium]
MSLFFWLVLISCCLSAQIEKTQVAGVYQGKTLFIQNPYEPRSKSFCIESIEINGRQLAFNKKSSAVKIDFDNIDLNAPVHILIVHDEQCAPIIINPDAINFHSIFSITQIDFQDSVLVWNTVGEEESFRYTVEKYKLGIWEEMKQYPSQGQFGGSQYVHYPLLDEGANKLRVRCEMGDGSYILSDEVDFHFYAEPVTFTPFATSTSIKLSRNATYEIFDAGGTLVMTGEGITIDVSSLRKGDYVVYFDKKDPGMFEKK